MNCCLPDTPDETATDDENLPAGAGGVTASGKCPHCRAVGRAVTRRTILLMLRPALFDRVGETNWRFCAAPACQVVYFAEEGEAVMTAAELRVRVGVKERADPVPLCYCFGFDAADVRAEIAQTGRSTIPQRIAALVRQGLCACETRNPSGACCFGEVNKTVRRLMDESLSDAQCEGVTCKT